MNKNTERIIKKANEVVSTTRIKNQERYNVFLNFIKTTLDYDFTGRILVDIEGSILYANTVFLKNLGYKRRDILGTNYISYVHPDDVKKTIEANTSYVKDEIEAQIEKPFFSNRYKTKDGSYIKINWYAGHFDTEIKIGIAQCTFDK